VPRSGSAGTTPRRTGTTRRTTGGTTCRCSSGSRPQRGYRHLLKRRDLERFIELIPDWDVLSEGLRWVVLSGDTRRMGYHRPGEVGVCAWEAGLWCEDMAHDWYREHAETLERLGVRVRKAGYRWVAEWTEDQARAFQLLHVFVHELGHHHDLMTTSSRCDAARGEPFAERFALELEERVWDDFVRVFPL
jgi:hypothetical protein